MRWTERVHFVRAGLVVGAALVLIASISANNPVYAQSSLPPLPSPGFVPPYEIMRIVRGAGFEPLAPPLREGTTYVLRATDSDGIVVRIAVDAHSGAIRDANRIVSAPGNYPGDAQLGLAYQSPSNVTPDAFAALSNGLRQMAPGSEISEPLLSTQAILEDPPLPRPRPAKLAARKTRGTTKAND
jgi:hypothetical protein